MRGIVSYGTTYGSTELYAKELAKQLGFDCFSYNKLSKDKLRNYDVIIHGGGVYAGRILGLEDIVKLLEGINEIKLYVFTVGLTNPIESSETIKNQLEQQIPPILFNQERIFNLQGRVNYGKLKFPHKAIMTMLLKSMKKKAIQDQQVNPKVEINGKNISYVDLDTLLPMIKYIQTENS